MKPLDLVCSRRHVLQALSLGAAAGLARGVLAEELAATPRVDEGPFYPDKMPLDTDNDLLIINDSLTPAVGEITHLSGRILSTAGEPLRNAFVEIWQVDSQGAYLHSQTANRENRDKNFQGYGRFLTDGEGRYYFRTVKPVAYPGRCPHIHFGVSRNGQRICTTQMFIKGDPANARDMLFSRIGSPEEQDRVSVDFKPIKDSRLNELAANFDIVLGVTPQDPTDAPLKGGIGKSDRGRGGFPGGGRPPRQ
jgi:protocatechuate 3,4-dioxygenase beta subunit